eukprot:EG_transcript_3910
MPIQFAVHSQPGTGRHNVDRSRVVKTLAKQPRLSASYAFLGLYAGFDGPACAEFAAEHLHEEVACSDAFLRGDLGRALEQAYLSTDQRFFAEGPKGDTSGASVVTVVLSFQPNTRRLCIANAGDCRALLCREGQAIVLTADHSLANPAERRRVEAAHGEVVGGRLMATCPVARALGVRVLKRRPWVLATPFVRQLAVSEGDAFVVLATAPFWRALEDKAVPARVAQLLTDHSHNLQEVCAALAAVAAQRCPGEAVTVGLILLHPPAEALRDGANATFNEEDASVRQAPRPEAADPSTPEEAPEAQQAYLVLTVRRGRGLTRSERSDNPRPFVAVTALPDSRQEAFETSVQPPSAEPVWNESHAFVLEGLTDLLVEVYDRDTFGREGLGAVQVPLRELRLGPAPSTHWIPVYRHRQCVGELQLEASLHHGVPNPASLDPAAAAPLPAEPTPHLVSVLVRALRDLPSSAAASAAYAVRVSNPKQTCTTSAKRHAPQMQWEDRFTFDLAGHPTLRFEVLLLDGATGTVVCAADLPLRDVALTEAPLEDLLSLQGLDGGPAGELVVAVAPQSSAPGGKSPASPALRPSRSPSPPRDASRAAAAERVAEERRRRARRRQTEELRQQVVRQRRLNAELREEHGRERSRLQNALSGERVSPALWLHGTPAFPPRRAPNGTYPPAPWPPPWPNDSPAPEPQYPSYSPRAPHAPSPLDLPGPPHRPSPAREPFRRPRPRGAQRTQESRGWF